MARINFENIKKIEKERYTRHKEDRLTTYSVFELEGTEYFQIDMYGSANREEPDSVSQSIQLSKDDAQKLLDLLKKEFGL